ncbi:hypothetical protein CHLRE_02g081850v5 [Chlamydomonas reinhardtii]|uniref:Glycosyltransferase n=1 Tax=Chlamydomonas reinhardtii TaxID=3055 RepID=A0A2K3E0L6_CHLRE|nr:uncharacterized protein CHLRE_02g081850v5 [Chlamydomonas reinhardtii]PNW86321.1 hypothetical protein CHLRE_02g081850v5 [Chlamydomonas reinhardtii]
MTRPSPGGRASRAAQCDYTSREVALVFPRPSRQAGWYGLLLLLGCGATVATAGLEYCFASPELNPKKFADPCVILKKTCVFQNVLVTFDPDMSRRQLPTMPFARWNFPSGKTNSDAFRGQQPYYSPFLRRAGPAELEPPELQDPVFSACTVPLVVMSDWAFNVGEFLAEVMPMVHKSIFELGLDPNVSLVYAVPHGLALTTFHRVLLQPYSRYGVTSLAEIGRLDRQDAPAMWSAEGRHINCFEKMAVCKWQGGRNHKGVPVAKVGAELVRRLTTGRPPLPPDPLGFGSVYRIAGYKEWRPPKDPKKKKTKKPKPKRQRDVAEDNLAAEDAEAAEAGPPKLRVLIESRHGMTRNLRNLPELLNVCERADKQGFKAGPFRGIACREYSFSDPHAASSQSVAPDHFLTNVAAVRSAHVLVMQHGAGAINSFFMRQQDAGPSALVELRPCKWGTKYGFWPDSYEPQLHALSDDAIRVFVYNVEDRRQCQASDYMAMVNNDTLPASALSALPAMRARDQHLELIPSQFMEVLTHVASLMANLSDYRRAREENRLHAYALPGGGPVWYGPLGMAEYEDYFRKQGWRKPKALEEEEKEEGEEEGEQEDEGEEDQ